MFLMDGWDALKARADEFLPEGSLRARLARGVFWSGMGTFVAQGLAWAAAIVVFRILGSKAYGEFGIIRSTVVMFGVFAGLGLTLAATKHVAEFRKDDPARAGRVIGLLSIFAVAGGLFVATVMYFLASYLAVHTIKAVHLTTELRISCVLLLVQAVDGALLGALAGLEAFRTVAKVSLFRGLLHFPILTVGTWFWGLRGAVCGLVAVMVCASVIDLFALRWETHQRDVRISFRHVSQEMPIFWKFMLPISLGGFVYGPVVWLANTLLVRQPDGYAHLGLFSAAGTMKQVVVMAALPIGAVLLPMLSSAEGRKSHLFQKANILLTWMIGMLVAVPVVCFPGLVGKLFGTGAAGQPFNITLVLVVFSAAILAYKEGLARIFIARNLTWWGLLSNGVWAVLFLAAMVVGRYYGSIGMAAAYAFAYGVNTLIFVPFYIRRGLASRELLWSWSVLAVWLALAGAVVMNFFEPALLLRIPAAVLLLLVLGFAARRMILRSPAQATA